MSVTLLLIPGALAIAGAVGGVGALGAAVQARDARRADEHEPVDASAAEHGARGGDERAAAPVPVPVQVRTRMKDATLLAAALADLGAADLAVADDEVSATLGERRLEMQRGADGIWEAHVTGANEAEAGELIASLDAAYALRVQQTVAERIRQRAGAAGFSLLSETRQEDRSLTMVLEVRGGAE
ncbi:hypothetical protein NHL51_11685 [Leucobacter sp. gxy201]|uniref:hypothetical protein n=1 Tax=Leucobacter sp. gxy201 TaxID=2957200 RepID=UPI003DA093FC